MKKELFDILSTDLIRGIFDNGSMKITQLNAVMSLLLKTGTAFDFSFNPGNSRTAPSGTLTIFLRPDITISIQISFESGKLIFNNPFTGQPLP